MLERRRDRAAVTLLAPGIEPRDLVGFGFGRNGQHRARGGGQRRRLGFGEAIDADHDLLAALDRFDAA